MSQDIRYKIAVYGSADGDYRDFLPVATKVGEILGEYASSVIVVTGACSGLPYAAAKAAAKEGAEIWGFASSLDLAELQAEYPDDDLTFYKRLIYVPSEFPFAKNDLARKKYRNVISAATCDAAIIISGRWGTLNEFTNLIDFGKTVGVLTGSGGIADELPALASKISKNDQGPVIFEPQPKVLIKKILDSL